MKREVYSILAHVPIYNFLVVRQVGMLEVVEEQLLSSWWKEAERDMGRARKGEIPFQVMPAVTHLF